MLDDKTILKLSDLTAHWHQDKPWFETREIERLLGLSGIFGLLRVSRVISNGKCRAGYDNCRNPITLIDSDGLIEVWASADGNNELDAVRYVNSLEPEKRRYYAGTMYRENFCDSSLMNIV